MNRKPSISRRNRIHWHYVRDDALFSTIKVVSRHQATQQYGVILPIELTTAAIRNSKRPLRATTPVEPTDLQRTEAEQLKIVLKRSRKETHISQQSGSGTGEGTSSKPGVSPFFKAFLVTADVPEIYMQEFWATTYVHQHSIRFKMDTRKNIVDLKAFREMLHISPRIKTLTDVNVNKLFQPWRSFAVVVSRHQNTQQYGAILPIDLTTEDIRNTKAYKEYYACATGEAAPKPKASARRKRGGSDSSTTPPTAVASPRSIITVASALRLTAAAKGKQPARVTSPTDPSEVERTEAEQLKIVLKRSRLETHISQHGGSSTDEGTDSKQGVLDVPSDDSEEEISWNSSDDEDVDDQDKGRHDDEGEKNDESDADDDDQDDAEKDDNDDDDNDEEEIAKLDEQEDTKSGEGDAEETKSNEESIEEETREEEEESFDPIPRTPEESEDDGNGEEDQGLRVRGLQVSQDIEDSHVTLTPVQPDGVESIFTTASSPIAPIQTSTPIMTPSTIATIITSNKVKSLEVNFSEFMQTNQFAEAVSKILGIVHQYMTQQMMEAVREAVQIQIDRFQDSFQRENDEFLCTIDENMKKIIKGQAEVLTRSSHSSRTSYGVAADLTEMELKKILIEKMEGNKSIQRSDEQRNLYKALVDVYEADKTILESYGDTTILKRRRGDDDDQKGPPAGSDRGSKRRREGGEPESASTPSEPATRIASRSTTGTQSRQMSASESAFAEEPVQTTCQMDEPPHPVFETGAEDQPIVQTSQHPECLTELEYHLEEVYKATTDQLDWVNPEGQQYPHNLLQPLPLILDNRGRRVIPFEHFINNDLEYLQGGASSRKYTTSVTKTKAADYGHIKWIEDLVPRTMWIQEPLNYDKHVLWGVSHWGRKRQQFYGFAVNRESALDVYSKR
nr:hypothetical protein [Tanacetum cinerariifolium]